MPDIEAVKIWCKNADKTLKDISEYFGIPIKSIEKFCNQHNIPYKGIPQAERDRLTVSTIIAQNPRLSTKKLIQLICEYVNIPQELATYYIRKAAQNHVKVSEQKVKHKNKIISEQKVRNKIEEKSDSYSEQNEFLTSFPKMLRGQSLEKIIKTIRSEFKKSKDLYSLTLFEIADKFNLRSAGSAISILCRVHTKCAKPKLNVDPVKVIKKFVKDSSEKLDVVDVSVQTGYSFSLISSIVNKYNLDVKKVSRSGKQTVLAIFNKYQIQEKKK